MSPDRERLGPHPSTDELAEYHGAAGETAPDPDRREEIREHLTSCPECSEWLLDYALFADEEPGGDSDLVAASWNRRRERTWDRIEESLPAAPSAIRPSPVQHVLGVLTTAGLAAACAVLAVLLWQARQEIRQPVQEFEMRLTPAELVIEPPPHRGPPDDPPAGRQVFRPPRGHRLVLTLELPDGMSTEGKVWAAEVLPPTGEGPGYVQRATPQAGFVRVELEPDPAPGRYRVNLYRFEGDRPMRVARYGFRIGLPEEVPAEPAEDPPGRP